jgi:hypothetical protein
MKAPAVEGAIDYNDTEHTINQIELLQIKIRLF